MIRYTSNRRQVMEAMEQANNRMLDAVGRAGEGYVKLMTPVATGALRDSISHKVDDKAVFVGSTLTSEDYPIYQEKGTSKMSAQPYIQPGIHNNLQSLKTIAERNYRL